MKKHSDRDNVEKELDLGLQTLDPARPETLHESHIKTLHESRLRDCRSHVLSSKIIMIPTRNLQLNL